MGNYSYSGMREMARANEIAMVLSSFDQQIIYDIVQEKLVTRFDNVISTLNGNLVQACDQNFKYIKVSYPYNVQEINDVEAETYQTIVNLLCDFYKINYKLPEYEGADDQRAVYYFTAYFLYDFLVDNFFKNISIFYAGYLINNKDAIYQSMGLDKFKKEKNSSISYAKQVYSDSKIAAISANIIHVVKNMATFDITVKDILANIYGRPDIVEPMSAIISSIDYDFFKEVYKVPANVEALLFTDIRLRLQSLSNTINNI